MAFIEDPLFGANPLMAAQAIGGILQNVKEHMLFWYGMQIHAIASEAAGTDVSEFMTIKDAEVQTKFDQMLAAATNKVHAQTVQYFGKLPPAIAKAQALLKQYSPPPPMDPSVVAGQKVQADAQAKMADTQIKQQQLQQDAQQSAAELQQKSQQAAQQAATDAAQQQLDAKLSDGANQTQLQKATMDNSTKTNVVQAQDATKLTVTAEDNNVAMQIAGAELAAGKHTNIKNGQAVGKEDGAAK
jgi:type IV secretory pathway VirB10-like protein